MRRRKESTRLQWWKWGEESACGHETHVDGPDGPSQSFCILPGQTSYVTNDTLASNLF